MRISKQKIKSVYLDYAAATPVSSAVLKSMLPYLKDQYGNPSALYKLGQTAALAVQDSRVQIARIIHALPDNIIFTSGGTEANNLAIFGTAKAFGKPGHIITTPIEHHAVYNPVKQLEKEGWDVAYLPVDSYGLINVDNLAKAIKPDTVMVSVMAANNEIGTIEPIAEIGKVILKYRKQNNSIYPYFHSDACQATPYLDINVEQWHVDLLTINAGKMYGPKGTGALYARRGVKLNPIQLGGSQEMGLRSGTENVAGAVGLAVAFGEIQKTKDKEAERLSALSKYFFKAIQKIYPAVKLNGPALGASRLPNNTNVSFPGLEGEAIVLYLDNWGVMCSTGSACANIAYEKSLTLEAIGLNSEDIDSSVRFTLGKTTTKADLDYAVKALAAVIKFLKK